LSNASETALFVNAALTAQAHRIARKAQTGTQGPAADRRGLNMRFTILRERKTLAFATLAFALGGVAAAVVGSSIVAMAQTMPMISQKGREFRPGDISIPKGGSIMIVNDDGDLRHHAYIDADNFKFDSGDQEPGSKTVVTFPLAGDFDVLCAIHPKMHLTVHVK
jgi:plastocyanin